MFVYISTGVMMYKERFRIPINFFFSINQFLYSFATRCGEANFLWVHSCIPLFIEKALHIRGKKGKSFVEL